MSDPEYVFALDTETTGFRGVHKITEMAAFAIHIPSLEVVSQGSLQIRLTESQIQHMTPEAREVQGWSEERNREGIPLEEAVAQFQSWLAGFSIIGFAAHNADFDRYHLTQDGFIPPRQRWFCTRRGLRIHEQRTRAKLENNKLASLASLCGVENQEAHRSHADAWVATQGLIWLLRHGISLADMAFQ